MRGYQLRRLPACCMGVMSLQLHPATWFLLLLVPSGCDPNLTASYNMLSCVVTPSAYRFQF